MKLSQFVRGLRRRHLGFRPTSLLALLLLPLPALSTGCPEESAETTADAGFDGSDLLGTDSGLDTTDVGAPDANTEDSSSCQDGPFISFMTDDGMVLRNAATGVEAMVFSMTADERFPVRLVDFTGSPLPDRSEGESAPQWAFRLLRWSPDGTQLAMTFEHRVNIPEIGLVSARDLVADFTDGLTVHYVGTGFITSWDLDGVRLVRDVCEFVDAGTYLPCESFGISVRRIRVYDTTTGRDVDLTGDNVSEHGPQWLPAGDEVLFVSARAHQSEEERAETETRLLRRSVSAVGGSFEVFVVRRPGDYAVSPLGDQTLVTHADPDGSWQLLSYPMEEGEPRTLIRALWVGDPEFSSDAEYLGITIRDDGDELSRYEVRDLGGAVVDHLESTAWANWSPPTFYPSHGPLVAELGLSSCR